MAKKRLGIDALFVSTVVPDADSVAVRKLPLERISPNPNQPRRRIEASALNALVESIRHSGVLQPIIVREIKSTEITNISAQNFYQIVAGERRFQASRLAGLSEIPVIVRTLSDEESLQLALIENLQREDLNPVEETEGYLALLKIRLRLESDFASFAKPNDIDPYGDVLRLLFAMNNNRKVQDPAAIRRVNNNVVINLSTIVEEVFTAIGKTNWLSFVQHRLPLRRLPEDVLEALRTGKIEYTKARAIGRLSAENLACSEEDALELRKSLLDKAISESLSLGAIRELIEEQTAKLVEEKKKNKPANDQVKLKVLARETTKQLSKLRLNKLSKDHQAQLQEKLSELAQLVESLSTV